MENSAQPIDLLDNNKPQNNKSSEERKAIASIVIASTILLAIMVSAVIILITTSDALESTENSINNSAEKPTNKPIAKKEKFIGSYRGEYKSSTATKSSQLEILKDHTCKHSFYDNYPYACTWEPTEDENTIAITVKGVGGLKRKTVEECESTKAESYADNDVFEVYVYPEEYATKEGFACTVAPVIGGSLKLLDNGSLEGSDITYIPID